MNDFYQNVIEERKEENNLRDYLFSKQNERIRTCNEIKLMKQEIEQDEIEDFWMRDNEIKREKMNAMRKLMKDNSKLENDILKKENEQALKIKQIQDEKNLQFHNIQNSHKLNLNTLEMNQKRIEHDNIIAIKELDNINNSRYYKYQLEKMDIENKHQNNMKKEEINIKKALGGVSRQGVAFISGEEENKYSRESLKNINYLLDTIGELSAQVRINIIIEK